MSRTNPKAKLVALVMIVGFILAGCDAAQTFKNLVKVANESYQTAWKISYAVSTDADIPLEAKREFRAAVEPVMQVAESAIIAATTGLKIYIQVKDGGTVIDENGNVLSEKNAYQIMFEAVQTMVKAIPKLVYAVNNAGKAFGYSMIVPEDITKALNAK